jgi:hypothetical protein
VRVLVLVQEEQVVAGKENLRGQDHDTGAGAGAGTDAGAGIKEMGGG